MKNNLDNQNSYFNKYIKDAFLQLGKKQSEVIADLQVSQPYVSALMNGRKPVGKEMAGKLNSLYGFDIAKVMSIASPLTPNQQKTILKKLKKLFISLRNRITPEQQQAFKEYEALLSQGETVVTQELIEEIATTFPDINKEWITDNKGTMFLSDNTLINGKDLSHSISKLKSKNGTEEVSPVAEQNYMMVEYVDLSASAGMLGGDFSADVIDKLPDTHKRLVPREYREGSYLVVRVNGDSMDDGTKRSLSDSDEILVRLWTDGMNTLPIHNKLFVLTTHSGCIVKQITKIDHNKKVITCHSFNPLYPDQVVDFNELIQIFTVEKIVNSKIRF
jgi:hypothetical protein|nr:MAG TPA: hypothetical protein [Caudoviricetes sp.]